jgi:hypothetical protein
VADSVSGNPLYGVAIATSNTADRTASDSTGAFTLSIPAGTPVMLTFTGRGFEQVGQVVSSTGNVDLGRVQLLPQAFALAPIEASVSQLDQRLRQYLGQIRVIGPDLLGHSGDKDLMDFLVHRVPLRPTPCNQTDMGRMTECFLVRGWPERPKVFINEVQFTSISMATVFRPEDVARVEVFAGGKMVRIYTRAYLEMMARAQPRLEALPPT